MATRSFKRDSRGRFSAVESRSGAGSRKLSAEQKAARAQDAEVKALKEQRAVSKADELVSSAEAGIKSAEQEYKRAKKVGSDDVLDTAWNKRIAAHQRLAAALKRRARAGQ